MINDRFVRWQTILRVQVSFINNVLITISIAITGFIISLIGDPEFNLICCQKIFFTFGLLLVFASIWFGLIAAISRLKDFKTTLKKIKSEKEGIALSELEEMKELMARYGKITWFLLYSQIITLCFGTINLTIAICWIYHEKLF